MTSGPRPLPQPGAEHLSETLVSLEDVSKSFGGRRVLAGVDLKIRSGEIHGLMGQNGSGKSTLVKILAGYHAPDPGSKAWIGGATRTLPLRLHELRECGLCFVHQDLALAETMSVTENLLISSQHTRPGWRIAHGAERHRVQDALRRFGYGHINPDAHVLDLTAEERAIVAILRAAEQIRHVGRRGLLVLDEATASLSGESVRRLSEAIRHFATDGHAVLFISHRIDEVRDLTNRITILRDGRSVATVDTASTNEDEVLRLLLGRELGEFYPVHHDARADAIIRVEGLSSKSVHNVSLAVRAGEIVGLTGLAGMGHDDVPYLLFGAKQAAAGTLTLERQTTELRTMSPSAAIKLGMVLIPGDRQLLGGSPTATTLENVTLPALGRYSHRGRLRHRAEKEAVSRWLADFRVTPAKPDEVFGRLSGGNQQKALLAKWLMLEPRVMLLHEPTHGIDIGSRQEILKRIRDEVQRGACALLVTNEYEDLAHLCDQVLVFRNGEVRTALSGATLTADAIIDATMAVS